MILSTLILTASVMVGALIANWFRSGKGLRLKMLTAFSGAYLLALALMHLLPEVYTDSHHHHSDGSVHMDLWPGLLVMVGFVFQLFLEITSHGVEHGHDHQDLKGPKKDIPFAALLSLCLHSVVESIPIGTQSINPLENGLFWGIVLHHIPVSIVLYSLLRDRKLSVKLSIGLLLLFALMSPFGMLIGKWLPEINNINRYATAFVAGIFLHISTTILFESDQNHRFNLLKIAMVVLATLVAAIFSMH